MTPFQLFIEQCDSEDLTQLLSGETGIGCNDTDYLLDKQGIALNKLDIDGLQTKDDILKIEQEILTSLYQTHPLCRSEFDYQAQQLFIKNPPEKFCSHPDNPKHLALMIEGTQLVTVDFNDARNQYGYFCEQNKALDLAKARQLVMKWSSTGEAYETYRAKTYCRYNCD